MDVPVPEYRLDDSTNLRGVRVGVPAEYFVEGMQPAVETAVRQAVEQYRTMGAEVYSDQPAAYRICFAGLLPDCSGGSLCKPGAL
jgi:Asp-tRNA(Asn)/Glu-tRNA(Gln) amidotransferase A subunit family amidase